MGAYVLKLPGMCLPSTIMAASWYDFVYGGTDAQKQGDKDPQERGSEKISKDKARGQDVDLCDY